MIIKILPRKSPSYKSLIDYIFKEGKADGKPHIITHNLRSDTKEGWLQEFLQNEASRQHIRSDQTYLYHEILSFSNKENKESITPEMLDDIARKYISMRGNEGQFVGSIHQDRDHIHMHFCTSGVKLHTGMAMRLSHEQLKDLKINLQEYHKEKYPELEHSFPQHGKGREYLTDREWYMKQREQRALVKEELAQKIADCYTKAHTQKDFLELLQAEDLHYYERNGKPTGICHEDSKYRFSRLGLTDAMFKVLPVDRREEDKALAEIRAIREENEARDRDLDDRENPGGREIEDENKDPDSSPDEPQFDSGDDMDR